MGLRCLLRVASDGCERPLSIPAIAEAEGLSPQYAAKLLRQLRIGGLLTSVRGPTGGSRLARAASCISVWQVLEVLDDSLLTERYCECAPAARADCHRTTRCAVEGLWRRVAEQLRATLEATTLEELCATDETKAGERVELSLLQSTQNASHGGPTWPSSN